MTRSVLVLLLTSLWTAPFAAQDPADALLRVAANSQARSAAFELTPDMQLTVRVEQQPTTADGVVRVYVFDQANVLRAMDDPEVAADVFRFSPHAAGQYTVVVLNTNTSDVAVRIGSIRTRAGRQAAADFAVVRVLYATNRKLLAGTPLQFGGDPAELTYGYADVSMPRDHRGGALEAPTIWRLEFREDPNKHVVLLRATRESDVDFFGQFNERLTQSPGKRALVFVHGFNQTFDEAIRRTAQLAYDLQFAGPAVTFSWPSQGSVTPLSYTKDQRNADVSAQVLKDFLLRMRATTPTVTIHVIAHSMGNRVLAQALEQMGSAPGRPLGQVAMMAPDIDAQLFRQAAKEIAARASRVTLYASSQDFALKAAQRVAGYPRAGAGGTDVVVVPGIDTIDASSVETSTLGLGHSYYGDSGTILADLFALIQGRLPAERFGLRPMTAPAGKYWLFQPGAR
jgi:esterase/lipase superfamily enzyme